MRLAHVQEQQLRKMVEPRVRFVRVFKVGSNAPAPFCGTCPPSRARAIVASNASLAKEVAQPRWRGDASEGE